MAINIIRRKKNTHHRNAFDLLGVDSPFRLDVDARAAMTSSCRDTDYIKKVAGAGGYKKYKKYDVQIMHNGLLVKRGGYYGKWMEQIIESLKGHHEPQEEKVFHEILKRIDSKSPTMIELGSFWSYYSLWFHKEMRNAKNICCEPDINNIEVGKINAKINNAKIKFINAAAGEDSSGHIDFPLESQPGLLKRVPILPVDKIVDDEGLDNVDILHMDVQGYELSAIRGAVNAIQDGKVRFIVVSTHHYSISRDPLTHQKCEDMIRSLGGHIISSHTVAESFSGDGLIVASFSQKDQDTSISVSINSSENSLYRPYEYDLDMMIKEYNKVTNNI